MSTENRRDSVFRVQGRSMKCLRREVRGRYWKNGMVEGWKDGKMERWKDGKMEDWGGGTCRC